MLSPKRVNLLLAAILAGLSMVFVIATYSIADVNAESKGSGPTLKSKILRRKNRLNSKLDAAEVAALRKAAKPQEERVFEDKIPKHLPIKVKIRAEKEKAAKDMDNERWHRDLEIEIKNTGEKPIYYLSFIIEIPEIKLAGNPVSVHIRYGHHSLFDDSKGKSEPEDIPIRPRETYILRLDDEAARAWEQWQTREKWSQPKHVIIEFEQLSFGDGTGFWGNGAPWPYPKGSQKPSQVLSLPRTPGQDIKTHHATSTRAKSQWTNLIGGESTVSWSTSFRFGECPSLTRLSTGPQTAPEMQSCCPGSCRFVDVYEANYCYYCGKVLSRANGVSCFYEFDGVCATVIHAQELCDDGIYCPYDKTYPCGYTPPSPTPTPDTPTPTPTPTAPPCDPATKPNNTNCTCDTTPYIIGGASPQWSCSCAAGTYANYTTFGSNQGCEPNKYNNGSNCCVCTVQECPDGSTPNKTTCECPTPTPTPSEGGGGGDDGSGEPIYDRQCMDYYYVYFYSYDGGNTWYYSHREYAGCWMDYY